MVYPMNDKHLVSFYVSHTIENVIFFSKYRLSRRAYLKFLAQNSIVFVMSPFMRTTNSGTRRLKWIIILCIRARSNFLFVLLIELPVTAYTVTRARGTQTRRTQNSAKNTRKRVVRTLSGRSAEPTHAVLLPPHARDDPERNTRQFRKNIALFFTFSFFFFFVYVRTKHRMGEFLTSVKFNPPHRLISSNLH